MTEHTYEAVTFTNGRGRATVVIRDPRIVNRSAVVGRLVDGNGEPMLRRQFALPLALVIERHSLVRGPLGRFVLSLDEGE